MFIYGNGWSIVVTGVDLFLGGLALFGLYQQNEQQGKANEATSRRIEAERKISVLKQKREKRNQLRKARVQRASVVAQGVGQGGSASAPSSNVQGATAGLESQYAYNLSFLDQAKGLNTQALAASEQANVFTSNANTAGAVSAFASTFIPKPK